MKELSGSITMSEASTLDASFRVLWTGTHDTSALDRLVTLVDELDPSTLGRPMALHAGGDRIVSLSVRPQDAHSLLGHSAEVRPSVVTMPAQSAANERLLIGSADAVILTDGGPLVDDAAAARKLDAILEALTARRRRPELGGALTPGRVGWPHEQGSYISHRCGHYGNHRGCVRPEDD